MADPEDGFVGFRGGLTAPVEHFYLVARGESLPFEPRAFAIPAAGALAVSDHQGRAEIISSGFLAAGVLHPLRITAVDWANTDAAITGLLIGE